MQLNINQPINGIISPVNHNPNTVGNSQSLNQTYTGSNKQLIDLTNLADTQGFNYIQTVFIDNYDNEFDFIVEVLSTGQKIVCKAGKQGYFPIIADSKARFNIYSKGAATKPVTINFLNFIISQGTW